MQQQKDDFRSLLLLLGSMVIFGGIGLIRRLIPLPSSVIAMVRGLVGGGALLLLLLARRERLDLRSLGSEAPWLLLSGALAGLILAVGLACGSPGQFAGMLFRARISWPVFIGSAVVFYGLVQFLFRQGLRHGGGEIMDITVTIGGRKQAVRALYDTGNTLCDPANGEAVLVLEQQTLYALLPEEVSDILRQHLSPEEKMVHLHRICMGGGFSLLPFRSVGVPAGLMLAYRSESITVNGMDHRRALLALSEGPLSDGGAYHALWGGEEGRAYGKDLARRPAVDQGMDQAV